MICQRCQSDTGASDSCRSCANQLGNEFEATVYSKHVGTVHIETELPVVKPGPSAPDAWDLMLEARAKELGVKS